MEKIYFDPENAGSFGGVDALRRSAVLAIKGRGEKRKNLCVANTPTTATTATTTTTSRNKIQNWLSGQDVYTLHKPVRRRFPRSRVFSPGINHIWQADLVDLTSLSRHNDGYKFLLCVIDCFSKYAYVVPLKNKNSQTVKNAFASIIEKNDDSELLDWSILEPDGILPPWLGGCKPQFLQTDKGSEFLNTIFQKYLAVNNIKHYTTESELKACVVERFNRTLKNKMFRYFTFKRSYRYIDILQKLVKSYNNSFHTSIKTKPINVSYKNEGKIYDILYPRRATGWARGAGRATAKQKFKFNIRDAVRISDTKRTFERGFNQRWSYEIFFIKNRFSTLPHTYELKDAAEETIKGKFYAPELQKVAKKDIFEIEKVLKKRKLKNGKIQYLVRWAGYPPKFDSFVDEKNLKKCKKQGVD